MAAPAFPLRMTEEEYLAFDAAAEGERYEYWDGLVVPVHGCNEAGTVAMAGASPDHNQIVSNLMIEVGGRLRTQGCRLGTADQRIQMPSGRYVYPDLVFVCGEAHYTADDPAVLLNPTLLIEVVSPSTDRSDRAEKLRAYTAIESLRAYWIVEQTKPAATLVERDAGGGRLRFATGLDDNARSEALDLDVPLADLYALVDFPEGPR